MSKNSNLFSHTPSNHIVGKPFIILSSVESTNNYAMAKLHAGMVASGTCFLAIRQTAGKGQRGKSWVARAGENITLSALLRPLTSWQQPFLLSAATALACYDFFKNHATDNVKIKWPNDLYWNDRKAGGILIENVYHGYVWSQSIIGIGININQTDFPADTPNAVSLKQITGRSFDIIKLARQLTANLNARVQWMNNTASEKVLEEYNDCLYKKDQAVKLKKKNIVFETVVKSVSAAGALITQDSMERHFQFGEIEWI